MTGAPSNYSAAWFSRRQARARRSASAILPLVLDVLRPKSMVDLGCGTGTWLAVAREFGVEGILGVDGAYVDRAQLEIPDDCFSPHDLSRPFDLDRTFDLALSTEVAEHLPLESADNFVDSLTRLAPVVLFSAAVPFQGGEHHINEQWQDWWAEIFASRGFRAVDYIRPRVWSNPEVAYFYSQNLLLYVREDMLAETKALAEAAESAQPLRLVHPELYLTTVKRFPPRDQIDTRRYLSRARRALTYRVFARRRVR
jgi:SAM-dependent methyltransferase